MGSKCNKREATSQQDASAQGSITIMGCTWQLLDDLVSCSMCSQHVAQLLASMLELHPLPWRMVAHDVPTQACHLWLIECSPQLGMLTYTASLQACSVCSCQYTGHTSFPAGRCCSKRHIASKYCKQANPGTMICSQGWTVGYSKISQSMCALHVAKIASVPNELAKAACHTKMAEGYLGPVFKQWDVFLLGEFPKVLKPLRVCKPVQGDVWLHATPACT